MDSLQKAVVAEDASGTAKLKSVHADNPVYIQVKGELDALTADRQAAVKKRDELHANLEDYEKRMAQSPEVEREYRELARSLDSAQLKYQETLSKQTEVQISHNLETERKGEKFTMIEPPQPPEKPISPNRLLIIVLGLLSERGPRCGRGHRAGIARRLHSGPQRHPVDSGRAGAGLGPRHSNLCRQTETSACHDVYVEEA